LQPVLSSKQSGCSLSDHSLSERSKSEPFAELQKRIFLLLEYSNAHLSHRSYSLIFPTLISKLEFRTFLLLLLLRLFKKWKVSFRTVERRFNPLDQFTLIITILLSPMLRSIHACVQTYFEIANFFSNLDLILLSVDFENVHSLRFEQKVRAGSNFKRNRKNII